MVNVITNATTELRIMNIIIGIGAVSSAKIGDITDEIVPTIIINPRAVPLNITGNTDPART